jgi:hypothetical protein
MAKAAKKAATKKAATKKGSGTKSAGPKNPGPGSGPKSVPHGTIEGKDGVIPCAVNEIE